MCVRYDVSNEEEVGVMKSYRTVMVVVLSGTFDTHHRGDSENERSYQ